MALVGLVLKYIMIGGKTKAAAGLSVLRPVLAAGLLKFGIWFLPNTTDLRGEF